MSCEDEIANTSSGNVRSMHRYSVPMCINCIASEIHRQLVEVFGENGTSRELACQWVHQFWNKKRCDVHDLICERHPRLSLTSDSISRVRSLLMDDRRLTIRQLGWLMATETYNPIPWDAVHHNIKNELTMWNIKVQWVLCQLSDEHMCKRMAATIKFLTLYNREGEVFVQHMVTCVETWIHHYLAPTKQQNMVCKKSNELAPKNSNSNCWWIRSCPLPFGTERVLCTKSISHTRKMRVSHSAVTSIPYFISAIRSENSVVDISIFLKYCFIVIIKNKISIFS